MLSQVTVPKLDFKVPKIQVGKDIRERSHIHYHLEPLLYHYFALLCHRIAGDKEYGLCCGLQFINSLSCCRTGYWRLGWNIQNNQAVLVLSIGCHNTKKYLFVNICFWCCNMPFHCGMVFSRHVLSCIHHYTNNYSVDWSIWRRAQPHHILANLGNYYWRISQQKYVLPIWYKWTTNKRTIVHNFRSVFYFSFHHDGKL